MPIYAKGFRHQRSCPNTQVENALKGASYAISDLSDTESTSSDEGETQENREKEARKICSDRRCCTWFDLSNWFGYLSLELPPADFEACFTDVANGGAGLYEKLVVLGGKTLDIMAEMHFYEMYPAIKDLHLPADLRADKEAMRVLWARKRAERVTALPSLFLFGKSYLAMAQSLPTRQAVAKFVKACIGYCCQSADTENLYKWMPILIEHIFWTQKLRTERLAEDNAILQDLQEFLGYKWTHIPQRSDSPTGRELLRLYATDYFTKMSEETGVDPSRRAIWVDQEVEHFLTGSALPAFACLSMSLGPYVVAAENGGPTHAQNFTDMFESLVAACWIISTEEKVKIWMPSLIQRLRQAQLLLHMAQMGDKYFTNGTLIRKPAKHPVDIRQFASANNGMLNQFALWNVDPTRRPLTEGMCAFEGPLLTDSFHGCRAFPVDYPPVPLYYPAARPPATEQPACLPCCFVPRPPPRQVPGRPSGNGITLFDTDENKYELYLLGSQAFPQPRRRRPPLAAPVPRKKDATSHRANTCRLVRPSSFPASGRNRGTVELPRGTDASIQTSSAFWRPQSPPPAANVLGGHQTSTWNEAPQQSIHPSATAGQSQRHPPAAFKAVPQDTAMPSTPQEPRVKIRYVSDNGDEGGQQTNNVEVFIDDVLVHNQPLPNAPDAAGPDFRAILSTPNSNPVVLNFARTGEDGRPTVYVTEERQPQLPSPWILQNSDSTHKPRAYTVEPNIRVSNNFEAGVPAGSGCCLTSQCTKGSTQVLANSETAPAVDIIISPVVPPASHHRITSAAELTDIEPPSDACILGTYMKHCLPGSRDPPQAIQLVNEARDHSSDKQGELPQYMLASTECVLHAEANGKPQPIVNSVFMRCHSPAVLAETSTNEHEPELSLDCLSESSSAEGTFASSSSTDLGEHCDRECDRHHSTAASKIPPIRLAVEDDRVHISHLHGDCASKLVDSLQVILPAIRPISPVPQLNVGYRIARLFNQLSATLIPQKPRCNVALLHLRSI
ncbi:apicomplexan specific related protein [Cyclospora cayetanensis]|uniref:Apicomplexan specific related protein n=1 Tax=Cyclospora cayetanensis TaxID=88456 RepID=A0A1D3CUX8_9EIME|nr:apicomplexan specific related protein [Cyclospora cayetanensis]